MQYTGIISVGTPAVEFAVDFDTGLYLALTAGSSNDGAETTYSLAAFHSVIASVDHLPIQFSKKLCHNRQL